MTEGSWTPGTVSLTYQWQANGKSIKKATKKKFTITVKQKGKKLTVKVTAKATGYVAKTVTTKPTAKITG